MSFGEADVSYELPDILSKLTHFICITIAIYGRVPCCRETNTVTPSASRRTISATFPLEAAALNFLGSENLDVPIACFVPLIQDQNGEYASYITSYILAKEEAF